MSKQNAKGITDTQRSSSDSTEDRKKVEVLVDELLDKVMGGVDSAELCQHCNQSCGDCVQT